MDCHNCVDTGKGPGKFVAILDFDIDGCHRVACPRCGHYHFRVIKNGIVTEERWTNKTPLVEVAPQSVWASDVVDMVTTTAALFIRDRWLQKGAQDGHL